MLETFVQGQGTYLSFSGNTKRLGFFFALLSLIRHFEFNVKLRIDAKAIIILGHDVVVGGRRVGAEMI